jgi:hypothetical protein
MRILPLALLIKDLSIEKRFELVKEVSSITHAHNRSVISCFYYLEFALQLIKGKDKFEIYEKLKITVPEFLNSNKTVVIDYFFIAPYKIYPDETYFPLEYYTTLKAITCYTNYMKILNSEDPDSSESLVRFSNSLKFILKFCKDCDISLEKYKTYSTGTLPSFIDHLKSHKINYYTLHALTFSNIDVDSDILNFAFGDFWKTFQVTRNKYQSSKKMKVFGKQAIEKIKQPLNKHDNI